MTSVYELDPARSAPGRRLFEAARVRFDRSYWLAAFQGAAPGRLFVDDPIAPKSALLVRTFDYYLAGEVSTAIIEFLRDAPAEAHALDDFYGFVPLTNEWLHALQEAFPDLVQEMRRSWRFSEAGERAARSWTAHVPDGITVAPLSPDLARKADEDVGDEIERLVGSYAVFNGPYYGFAAIDAATGQVLSVAYTAGVTRDEVNLGVATAESARRRGLAKLVCQACCETANQLGQQVTWDCDHVNEASNALAKSLGFIEESSFVELGYPDPERGLPHRITPASTGVSWTPRENPAGVIRWTRVDVQAEVLTE